MEERYAGFLQFQTGDVQHFQSVEFLWIPKTCQLPGTGGKSEG